MPDALEKVLAAGLTGTADIARALGVSQRSVQRWVRQKSSPHPHKESRLLELAAVLEQAKATLPGDPAAAALWLRSPSGQLSWQVPLDLIRQGSFRQVIAALPPGPAQPTTRPR